MNIIAAGSLLLFLLLIYLTYNQDLALSAMLYLKTQMEFISVEL